MELLAYFGEPAINRYAERELPANPLAPSRERQEREHEEHGDDEGNKFSGAQASLRSRRSRVLPPRLTTRADTGPAEVARSPVPRGGIRARQQRALHPEHRVSIYDIGSVPERARLPPVDRSPERIGKFELAGRLSLRPTRPILRAPRERSHQPWTRLRSTMAAPHGRSARGRSRRLTARATSACATAAVSRARPSAPRPGAVQRSRRPSRPRPRALQRYPGPR